jgi:hypothetical protein
MGAKAAVASPIQSAASKLSSCTVPSWYPGDTSGHSWQAGCWAVRLATMQDFSPARLEPPSPFDRPDHYLRCDALATRWVYGSGRMFLCGERSAELLRDGEPVTPNPPGLVQQSQSLHARQKRFLTDPGGSHAFDSGESH